MKPLDQPDNEEEKNKYSEGITFESLANSISETFPNSFVIVLKKRIMFLRMNHNDRTIRTKSR